MNLISRVIQNLGAAVLLAIALFGCGSDSGTDPPPGSGPIVWERSYGDLTADQGWGIHLAPDGDLYIATFQTFIGASTDIVVYRLDSFGGVRWERRWSGPFTDKAFVITEEDGVVYVGGLTQRGIGPATSDALLLALDRDTGEVQWEFIYDSRGRYEEIDGIVVRPDAICISGWTESPETSMDVLLARVTKDGRLESAIAWGGPLWDEANGQMVELGGLLYLAGRFGGVGFGIGGDALFASFDAATLTEQWWTQDPFNGTEAALGLATDGTFLYSVGVRVRGTGSDLRIWSYDTAGVPRWRTDWGDDTDEVARAIALDPTQGSIVVAGSTDGHGAVGRDLLLLRVNHVGAVTDSLVYGTGGRDVAHEVTAGFGSIYTIGDTDGRGNGSTDAWVVAARADGW